MPPRPRTVQFSLSEEEFAEVSEGAAQQHLRYRQAGQLRIGHLRPLPGPDRARPSEAMMRSVSST